MLIQTCTKTCQPGPLVSMDVVGVSREFAGTQVIAALRSQDEIDAFITHCTNPVRSIRYIRVLSYDVYVHDLYIAFAMASGMVPLLLRWPRQMQHRQPLKPFRPPSPPLVASGPLSTLSCTSNGHPDHYLGTATPPLPSEVMTACRLPLSPSTCLLANGEV